MNCTVITGRLLLPRGERRPAPQQDPPIYAALVLEWRTGGRTVPVTRDGQRTALVAGVSGGR
ncbi:hypothetical protein [Streptomyces dysideae]|uniref:hypothetical protein n=1 Tax=Streptomyces dysideae TaxID=909626 RepID=UPI000B32F33F|nr:hypothetical protein [Streptomyces dysideae]